MKLETFFEKFELFADAPDAVAKIRELVLALSVRGKLVPQDASDELAAKALRACGVDLNRWTVGEGEHRHGVPDAWTWIRFAGVGEQRLGKMLDAQKNRGKPKRYLRNTNVQWMRFELEDLKTMRVEEREADELLLRRGDLLICEGGEPGRCAIWRDEESEIYFQKALHRVRPCETVLSEYLAINLQVDCRNGVLASYFTGATIKHLTGRSLAEYPIPIPPLAEQKRIVAKVDELMALCDRLEAQQQERETRHAALARASLARFAEAPTPDNLEFLFHKSYAICPTDLRKSILILAVEGRLCASSTTKRIRLDEVIQLISGQHLLAHEHNSEGRGIPYLTGPSDFGPTYPTPSRWTESPKIVAEPGDILITVKGSGVGKTNKLVTERTAISRQLMAVRVIGADPDFVHLVLMNAAEYFQSSMTGIAIPGIGRRDVLNLEVQLPPLAEQRRIVAKVDELMAWVDKLETQLATARTTAANLLVAAVAELINGKEGHAAADVSSGAHHRRDRTATFAECLQPE